MKKIIAFVSIICLSACCYNTKKSEFKVAMKDDIYSIMQSYIELYPQYNTFVLSSAMERTFSGKKADGFILGPDFPGLFPDGAHNISIDIDNKRIYIISNLANIFTASHQEKWINKNMKDTMVYDEWITEEGLNYVRNGIYIYSKDNSLKIMQRPDTFFFHYLPTKVKFINIRKKNNK